MCLLMQHVLVGVIADVPSEANFDGLHPFGRMSQLPFRSTSMLCLTSILIRDGPFPPITKEGLNHADQEYLGFPAQLAKC